MYLCCSCAFVRTESLLIFSFVFCLTPSTTSILTHTVNIRLEAPLHTHMCSHEPSIEYITRRKRDRRANVNQWFVRSLSDRNRIFKHFALFHLRFCFCLNRLCLLFLIPSMLCTESGNHQTDDTLASGQFCV